MHGYFVLTCVAFVSVTSPLRVSSFCFFCFPAQDSMSASLCHTPGLSSWRKRDRISGETPLSGFMGKPLKPQ